MRAHVAKSTVEGVTRVPGSKSYTIRAALCAAMAHGDSLIEGALHSEDTTTVFECIAALGAGVSESAGIVRVRGGRLHADGQPLWCQESGATFRFLAALAATIPGVTTLRCAPSLARRPIQPLVDAIRQLGVLCQFDAESGTLSIVGQRQSMGHVLLQGDVSSQFLSAMLLSGPRFDEGLRIDLPSPVVSERYVEMTRACMCRFGVDVEVAMGGRKYTVPGGGYAPTDYLVEGDWSGAVAILALGALVGDVRVAGLNNRSLQADTAVAELLEHMGARVEIGSEEVRVVNSALVACTFDVAESIDLLPVACALAAAADGVTRFTGIARARDKESDRVSVMADGLRRLGVRVDVYDDEMSVWGGGVSHGGVVSSGDDHRIAMAFGVLGAMVGNIIVEDAGCVAKTYPTFWDTLSSLGVKVQFDEQ